MCACVLWKKAPIQFCSEHIRVAFGRECHPPQRYLNRTHLRDKIAIMKPGWASPAAVRGGSSSAVLRFHQDIEKQPPGPNRCPLPRELVNVAGQDKPEEENGCWLQPWKTK